MKGRFIDTHVHLNIIAQQLKMTVDCVMKLQPSAMIAAVNVNCCADLGAHTNALSLQRTHSRVYGTFGLHPHYADKWTNDFRYMLLDALTDSKSVAVGECGLDYYRNLTPKHTQRKVFEAQMNIATDLSLPIVIHSRDAEEDTIDMLKYNLSGDHKIHLHCFTGSVGFANRFLSHFENGVIGFTGCVTFKNADAIRDAVESVSLDRLVLETDGPFMAPEPHRGQPSQPQYIPFIAHRIGQVKGCLAEDVLTATTNNAIRIYSLDV